VTDRSALKSGRTRSTTSSIPQPSPNGLPEAADWARERGRIRSTAAAMSRARLGMVPISSGSLTRLPVMVVVDRTERSCSPPARPKKAMARPPNPPEITLIRTERIVLKRFAKAFCGIVCAVRRESILSRFSRKASLARIENKPESVSFCSSRQVVSLECPTDVSNRVVEILHTQR
jgi:hypothetical protein